MSGMSKLDLVKLTTEDRLPELAKLDNLKEFLNQTPPDDWLETTPNGKAKTMPIGRVEWLLTNLFSEYRIETLREGTIFNSIYCAVRVHYINPVTGDWTWQDGEGAAPAKTASGAKASDMTAILNDSVQTGLPAAKSFAIKDACDHIGRIFGRDINRKGNFGFTGQYNQEPEKIELAIEAIKSAEKRGDFESILTSLSAEQQKQVTPIIKQRMEELKHATASK